MSETSETKISTVIERPLFVEIAFVQRELEM